ncbi:hypothetical protein [Paraburkholderia sp. BCC1876]|uniref:hypothetical protein n=1 Tax=Paraburkholderia sp. BCC1876 TaxID=2676303 RepID=UPI0015912C66|nr:hypothetical protein [Paraburkholderia sp. BCC1876]
MTDRGIYAALVDGIFGAGTANFNVADPSYNHVTGALGNPATFSKFSANFEQRLRRLAASVAADASLRTETVAAINKIATSGWDGAYAELCALDYFLADASTGPGNIVLDHTVSASQTLASEMGMQDANHDMRFPKLGVSMDTKLLSDKIGGILEGIFKDFRGAKKIKNLTILPSYNLGDDFVTYQTSRQKLLDELNHGVDVDVRPSSLISKVIPGLSYKFAWSPGVMTGESSYSPSEHAMNHHRLLFGHAKKFSKVEPTVIVFVIFPWAGERVFHFDDSKNLFFRQLGDHFFSDYLSSPVPANNFNGKIKSQILAGEVTKHLSGVVFLEDDSIEAKSPNNVNVKASFLWNPNALHPLAGSGLEATLQARSALNLRAVS